MKFWSRFEVKTYIAAVGSKSAEIVLKGAGDILDKPRARLRFLSNPEHIKAEPWEDRGSTLVFDRPLSTLPAILCLLQNEAPLFFNGNGILSTSQEPVEEKEGQLCIHLDSET
jgi:hypothetical protein